MKVLIVNTSERTGGAAVAASRLMNALRNNGIQATMLVRDKQTDEKSVIELGNSLRKKTLFIWERFVIWICNLFNTKNLFKVSIANTGFDITEQPEFKEADIIHLHWINQGMLSLDNIKKILLSGKPVVWTMHDMWECTSICHHAYTCDNFKKECKNCPFLRFPSGNDLAHRTFIKKSEIFRTAPFNVVTVSRWLAEQAKASTLLKDKRITVIPNTLSLSEFKWLDREQCRENLGLPKEKRILIFGAARIDDPIKGFDRVLETIQYLIDHNHYTKEELHLVTFGTFKHPKEYANRIPVTYTNIGWVKKSSTLSQLYSAADIAISASLYETFGQTLIEAQACGCIPVSFGNSGQSDIIEHKKNGFLAEYLSTESLAEGIIWGLTEGAGIDRQRMREDVFHRFSEQSVASQYIRLYEKSLSEPAVVEQD